MRSLTTAFYLLSAASTVVLFTNCTGGFEAKDSRDVRKFLATHPVMPSIHASMGTIPVDGVGTGATPNPNATPSPTPNTSPTPGSGAGAGAEPALVPAALICSNYFSAASGTNLVHAARNDKPTYIAYFDENNTPHCQQSVDLDAVLYEKAVVLPACPELAGKTVAFNIGTGTVSPPPSAIVEGTPGLPSYLEPVTTLLAPMDMPVYSAPGGYLAALVSNPSATPGLIYDKVQFDFKGTPSLVSHQQNGYQLLEVLNPVESQKLQLLYALNNAAGTTPAAVFNGEDYGNQADCAGRASPLIIQLRSPGAEAEPLVLSALEDGVMFDILGANAFPTAHEPRQISWLVPESRNDNYFLTLPNRNGEVNGIDQLFGDNTKGPDNGFAANGYEALRKYDANNDGEISRADLIYNRLRLWADTNGDGVAQASELHTLESRRVQSISLDYNVDFGEVDAHGNAIKYKSVATTDDGQMHVMYDIWFKVQSKLNR